MRDFGIGTYIRNLVQALAKLDRENHYILVALPGRRAGAERAAAEFRDRRLRAAGLRLARPGGLPAFLRRSARRPVPHSAERRPAAHAEALRGDHSRHEQPAVRASVRRAQAASACSSSGAGLQRAGRIIAVSDATRRDVENLFGIPPRRIRQIYNAPDPEFLRAAGAAAPGAVRSSGSAFWSATRSTTRSCCTPAPSARRRTSRAWWRPSRCARRAGEPPASTGTCA